MESTKPKKQWKQKILLFCFSILIAIVFGEVMMQIAMFALHKKGYYLWPPNLKAVFKPSTEIMPGISGDSQFIINSQGFRSDELTPAHTSRILAVGGSTTICGYLDQSETWPSLVQESLNRNLQKQQVWVGNGGISGLTSRHHVFALEYLPLQELKIDTVVVLAGVNDLTMRLSHEADYDSNLMDKNEARREYMLETFTGTFDGYPDDPIHKRSAIWQLLRRSKRMFFSPNVEDPDGRGYITWRQNRQHASELRNNLPDLSSALGEYARNLNKMIDTAKARSVRLIFMTQPAIWREGLPQNLESLLWLGGVGDFQKEMGKPYYSAGALEKGINAYNDTMRRVCQERGIECVDLAARLEKDTTVFYDDVHFNENGSRKAAEVLSQYMSERAPFRVVHANRVPDH